MESENLGISHAALCKRRSSLFKKASELAILCDAQVAIIIINPHGKVSEFSSFKSSVQNIVKRFKYCYRTGKPCPLMMEPENEVSREIQPRQNSERNNLRHVLGKDFNCTSVVLEEKFNQGMLSLKDIKMQLLNEELEQSRMQEEEAMQMNQILMKEAEDLQASFFPDMEGDARTSSREYISSSSLAAPPASPNGPETQHNFIIADAAASPPSTANFFMPIALHYGHLVEPADRPSTSSAAAAAASDENSLSSSQNTSTTKPLFHWLPRANDGPPSGYSSDIDGDKE